MATLKSPLRRPSSIKRGPDGKPLNFFMEQSAVSNRKKWTGREDFWAALRRNGTPAPQRWDEFEKWRQEAKDRSNA